MLKGLLLKGIRITRGKLVYIMPNNDKIYQAYMGEMGEKFQEQVRRRISWIVEQVGYHDPVWDIGCSQGITSILLAQKGKHVTGIDIQPESIEFAQSLLDEKYPELKDNLSFICADFYKYKSAEKARCIIITEVLEHLEDPELFLEIAADYLDKEGKLIVTVPFGVSNHPDHFSTFYMYSLYKLVSKFFSISHFEFLGRWMGLVACSKVSEHHRFKIGEDAIQREELNFLSIDKEATERIETLTAKLTECNEKYARSVNDYKKLKEWLEDKNKNIDQLRTSYQRQLEELNRRLEEQKSNYQRQLEELKSNYDKQLMEAKNLQDKMSRLLLEDVKIFDDQVNAFDSIKQYVRKLQTQNSYLTAEIQEYRRKFAKITGTWYGRLAIKLYKYLQVIKNRIKGK